MHILATLHWHALLVLVKPSVKQSVDKFCFPTMPKHALKEKEMPLRTTVHMRIDFRAHNVHRNCM